MSPDRSDELRQLLAQRLLILDGAMGTMVQRHGLTEADYRGQRFADHAKDLKGNNDLLVLTRPDVIGGIHSAYLDAGADIIETCTFNSTAVSQADYKLEALVYELNFEGARLARGLCDAATAKTPDKPRFVAGVLGPTSRTCSISPDVNDPGYRNVSFDALVTDYTEAIRGLVDGGADILLVETIFDTLNAKAALFAIEQFFDATGRRWPVMISGRRPKLSGIRCATCGRSRSASIAPWARRNCGSTSRTSAASPTASSRRTRTPACPTPLAATTRRRRCWPPRSATGPRVASSTSSAAAAAPRPITSAPSRRRWKACRPGVPPRLTFACACRDSSLATSAPIRCS